MLVHLKKTPIQIFVDIACRALAVPEILRKTKIHISIFSLGPLAKGNRAVTLTEILRKI
jgi:hypothetical protein